MSFENPQCVAVLILTIGAFVCFHFSWRLGRVDEPDAKISDDTGISATLVFAAGLACIGGAVLMLWHMKPGSP